MMGNDSLGDKIRRFQELTAKFENVDATKLPVEDVVKMVAAMTQFEDSLGQMNKAMERIILMDAITKDGLRK